MYGQEWTDLSQNWERGGVLVSEVMGVQVP